MLQIKRRLWEPPQAAAITIVYVEQPRTTIYKIGRRYVSTYQYLHAQFQRFSVKDAVDAVHAALKKLIFFYSKSGVMSEILKTPEIRVNRKQVLHKF